MVASARPWAYDRRRGVPPSRTIPKLPRAETRLAEGLANSEIEKRLVLSVRTVDHHVAAILQKLGVATRHEAVEQGGLLDPGGADG